jgi:outer membrane protein assembly factor BamB
MYGGYWKAWNLNCGQLAWTSEKMDYPWDEPPFGAYATMSAYGLLLRPGYSKIYAFNWSTGAIQWTYTAPAKYPYDSPYVNADGESVYPWNVEGWIADGKLYMYNTEHSATVPITRGWGLHCINMTTGEGLWNVTISGAASKHSSDLRVIADGYLFHFSGDGYMYVFGKGLSETTVTAPSSAVQVGEAFTITGTVLDMSPAQEGTPAISDESMSTWMEYIHQQQPKPTDTKGVTVSLTAIDPNNNYIQIGEATSNTDGTFGLSWIPEVPGLYRITATFAGTDSYGSSSASTFMSAVYPPDNSTPVPTQEPESIADLYFIPAIAGMMTTIIVIGAVLVILMLKKRP